MKYGAYLASCQQGRLAPATCPSEELLDPLARSERFILIGDANSARSAIERIAEPRAAFLQAAKAARHFEDRSFLPEGSLPATSSKAWALAILRAAASVSQNGGDGSRVEDYSRSVARRNLAPNPTYALIASNGYRNAGDLVSSRRMLTEALQVASKAKVIPTRPAPAAQRAFIRLRQTAFHDLLSIVDFPRYGLFLCSGTLLGFYRDGDFIPSDGDVDLGTLDPGGYHSLIALLRSSGDFYLSFGRQGSNFTARHVNGTKVDISLYEARPNGWAKTSHVYEWNFDGFELGELVTDYGRLPVPAPAEAYLSSMYEEWWVRRSGYDSRIHSPNLTHVSSEEVAQVMAGHYLQTYLRGGREACAGWKRKFEGLTAETSERIAPLIQVLDEARR